MNEEKPRLHVRFTNEELELIKTLFAESDEILRVCYKIFFQSPLTSDENALKQVVFAGEDMFKILDKFFFPDLENEQIFFGIDNWIDLQIFDKIPVQAELFIKAREKSVNYLKQQLDYSFGKGDEWVKFNDFLSFVDKTPDEKFIDLLARKEIINSIRTIFGTILVWAGTKKETVEETIKRIQKNSNK